MLQLLQATVQSVLTALNEQHKCWRRYNVTSLIYHYRGPVGPLSHHLNKCGHAVTPVRLLLAERWLMSGFRQKSKEVLLDSLPGQLSHLVKYSHICFTSCLKNYIYMSLQISKCYDKVAKMQSSDAKS